MAFPSDDLTTTNLDSGTGDSPAEARLELLAAVNKIKAIIASFGAASGIAPLNSLGKLATSFLSATDVTALLNVATTSKKGLMSAADKTKLDGLGNVPVATTTVAGAVELATSSETIAGTDTTRAVTPDGLYDVITGFSVPNGGYSKTTSGSWSFTTSNRTRSVKITLNGAGGGGSASISNFSGQAGHDGGDGGYSFKTMSITPGTVLSGTVGNHGVGGTSSGESGTAGTATTCTQSGQTANGGGGGTSAAAGANGSASGGSTNTTGAGNSGGVGGLGESYTTHPGANGQDGSVIITEYL